MRINHNITSWQDMNAQHNSPLESLEELLDKMDVHLSISPSSYQSDEQVRVQLVSLHQALLNAQTGISFLQSADTAFIKIKDILLQIGQLISMRTNTDTAANQQEIDETLKQLQGELKSLLHAETMSQTSNQKSTFNGAEESRPVLKEGDFTKSPVKEPVGQEVSSQKQEQKAAPNAQKSMPGFPLGNSKTDGLPESGTAAKVPVLGNDDAGKEVSLPIENKNQNMRITNEDHPDENKNEVQSRGQDIPADRSAAEVPGKMNQAFMKQENQAVQQAIQKMQVFVPDAGTSSVKVAQLTSPVTEKNSVNPAKNVKEPSQIPVNEQTVPLLDAEDAKESFLMPDEKMRLAAYAKNPPDVVNKVPMSEKSSMPKTVSVQNGGKNPENAPVPDQPEHTQNKVLPERLVTNASSPDSSSVKMATSSGYRVTAFLSFADPRPEEIIVNGQKLSIAIGDDDSGIFSKLQKLTGCAGIVPHRIEGGIEFASDRAFTVDGKVASASEYITEAVVKPEDGRVVTVSLAGYRFDMPASFSHDDIVRRMLDVGIPAGIFSCLVSGTAVIFKSFYPFPYNVSKDDQKKGDSNEQAVSGIGVIALILLVAFFAVILMKILH